MPTSLTLDTARRDDDKLVLIAVGEIDLSNIDAFNQALTAAGTGGSSMRLVGVQMVEQALHGGAHLSRRTACRQRSTTALRSWPHDRRHGP